MSAESRFSQVFVKIELFWFEDIEPLHEREVSFVESGDFAPTFQSDCCDNHIVVTDHFAGRFQLRPDARVLVSCLFRIRDDC